MNAVQEENSNSFKVLENVTTKKGARTIALDKNTHYIYLPIADFGETSEKSMDNPHLSIKPATFIVLDLELSDE